MRNITCHEYGRGRFWQVRIKRIHSAGVDKTHSKAFSYLAYGGKAKALKAAKAWRDAMLLRLPPPASRGHKRRLELGAKRLYRATTTYYDRKGQWWQSPAWHGFIRVEEGKHKLTKWSIDKWGDSEAKKRCQAWLDNKSRELQERMKKRRKRSLR